MYRWPLPRMVHARGIPSHRLTELQSKFPPTSFRGSDDSRLLSRAGERLKQHMSKSNRSDSAEKWHLRLYVAGKTPRSLAAQDNLKAICDKHLQGCYTIELVDLLKNPRLAKEHQIVAIPTLIRKLPEPLRKIVGDLSDTERTLVGLQLEPVASTTE